MSHGDTATVPVQELISAGPQPAARTLSTLMWLCVLVGSAVFLWALVQDAQVTWGIYYVNLLFFMGLAAGSCVIPAILQIVRATWATPVRRVAEANIAFLPVAFCLFLLTYYGKEYLFPWARAPMPGREWWMEADFVYARFFVLFIILFGVMAHFVRLSVRSDAGMMGEQGSSARWPQGLLRTMSAGWKGSATEVTEIQRKLSWYAPLLIALYAVIYSLFAFEMIMGMDVEWCSNMFGGFMFIGNIYVGWATTAIIVFYLGRHNSVFRRVVGRNHFQDLGSLTFAFTMLWGYMFLAQFLVQWYGNLPEETRWLIVRLREYPWKAWSWFTFACCFILPFILLLSRDLVRNGKAYRWVCLIIIVGIWCEKYLIVMPQLTGAHIPFGIVEVAVFLGFLGAYFLCLQTFLTRFPLVAISHPQTAGHYDW